jgi:dihydroorotate dehydrogenase electron transfer subunit
MVSFCAARFFVVNYSADDWMRISAVMMECDDLYKFCAAALEILLARDGWKLVPPQVALAGKYELNLPDAPAPRQRALPLLTAQKNDQTMVFCLNHPDRDALAQLAADIQLRDDDAFQTLAVLIAESDQTMDQLRSFEKTAQWPRGFFCSLDELQNLCEKTDPSGFQALRGQWPLARRPEAPAVLPEIANFEAEVLSNVVVGGEDSQHHKMRFRAPGLRNAFPGQFIMMDTRPGQPLRTNRPVIWEELRNSVEVTPQAYLKRPFGIHQTYYPHFKPESFSKLALPPTLAPILRLPFPFQFDIFYKVLPYGVGTHEMLRLKKGDRVQMLGPLGKRYDIRQLRALGVSDVHLIGGGVGMAPLIFMAQVLRFYGFAVKAFIGIESWERLKYFDDVERSFGEEPQAAHIYVDELLAAGLNREDIYVSCDRQDSSGFENVILQSNFLLGFSSELYKGFLKNQAESAAHVKEGAVMAFTCGPMPMMKAVRAITADYEIPLKVLMEKRMACGVGVCLSCVCKTRTSDGAEHYSRVCSDGPIFDARDLIWE